MSSAYSFLKRGKRTERKIERVTWSGVNKGVNIKKVISRDEQNEPKKLLKQLFWKTDCFNLCTGFS